MAIAMVCLVGAGGCGNDSKSEESASSESETAEVDLQAAISENPSPIGSCGTLSEPSPEDVPDGFDGLEVASSTACSGGSVSFIGVIQAESEEVARGEVSSGEILDNPDAPDIGDPERDGDFTCLRQSDDGSEVSVCITSLGDLVLYATGSGAAPADAIISEGLTPLVGWAQSAAE